MNSKVRDIDKVTTVKGAAAFTGASTGAIMNAIWKEKIEARKEFGTWLLDAASVIYWNKNRRGNQTNV